MVQVLLDKILLMNFPKIIKLQQHIIKINQNLNLKIQNGLNLILSIEKSLKKVLGNYDYVFICSAITSGAKNIVSKPEIFVSDNSNN